jgi:adenine/guanine/hypoxanthine permease
MATPSVAVPVPEGSRLERMFRIGERGSTVRTELIAGSATFLTMCYILFVNSSILSSVKDHNGYSLNFTQVLTITALVAGVMTLLMGVWANRPFALATGLGLNAFVAFTLVGGPASLTWPQASGVIVMEGVLITLLVVIERQGVSLREMVLDAIPLELRKAIGVGIGLFIALIGFVNAGVVVKGEGTLVAIAPRFNTWPLVIFSVGLVLTACLVQNKIKGALLWGIVGTTVLATIVNEAKSNTVFTDGSARIPHHWTSPDFGLVGNFSFSFWSALPFFTALAIVLSVMLSDFFDTAGTVTGIAAEAGMLDENGKLPGMKRVLLVDSLAAAAGGASGGSSNTTFIESQAGVSSGGRTGLTSVVVGILFLCSLILAPIAGIVPSVATAPILVVVGVMMFKLVADISWDDMRIAVPAFATVVLMPLTYSITNGVGAGFILYALISVFTGNARKVSPFLYVVSAIFAWYFWHGVIG